MCISVCSFFEKSSAIAIDVDDPPTVTVVKKKFDRIIRWQAEFGVKLYRQIKHADMNQVRRE